MSVSTKVVLQTLIPCIPGAIRTVILNKFGLSPCADKQDALVELIVYIVKAFSTLRRPVGLIQQRLSRDPGIKGRIWVSKVVATASDARVRDLVVEAVRLLGPGSGLEGGLILPDVCDVEVEWHGFRAQATRNSPRAAGSEEEQYRSLMKEVTTDVTVLYLHGGAFIMMDPATHRPVTYGLAKRSGGRCFSVRYRLSPQAPFPAALLDALTAYLYLLAPPEGAFHQPVPAKNIVFAGDSAGGNLACTLGLLLVTLRKAGVTSVLFHGKQVPLDLPAGMALNSPWCDISKSLPSRYRNAKYDYLVMPETVEDKTTQTPQKIAPILPPDEVWPTSPPRVEMYCPASMLRHPLVSPLNATTDMWKGCPPVFICGGNELLEDEMVVMARRIHLSGSSVHFYGYEGMPHCFAMVIKGHAVIKDCLDKWAAFCVDVVQGTLEQKETASWWKARTNPFQFYDVKLADMGLSDDEVENLLLRTNNLVRQEEDRAVREWEMAEKL